MFIGTTPELVQMSVSCGCGASFYQFNKSQQIHKLFVFSQCLVKETILLREYEDLTPIKPAECSPALVQAGMGVYFDEHSGQTPERQQVQWYGPGTKSNTEMEK